MSAICLRLPPCAANTSPRQTIAGPHCNGADNAAHKLALISRKVKIMIGGMTGWADEGLPFAHGTEEELLRPPQLESSSTGLGYQSRSIRIQSLVGFGCGVARRLPPSPLSSSKMMRRLSTLQA